MITTRCICIHAGYSLVWIVGFSKAVDKLRYNIADMFELSMEGIKSAIPCAFNRSLDIWRQSNITHISHASYFKYAFLFVYTHVNAASVQENALKFPLIFLFCSLPSLSSSVKMSLFLLCLLSSCMLTLSFASAEMETQGMNS